MARGDQLGRQWKIIHIFVSIRISQTFSATQNYRYLPFHPGILDEEILSYSKDIFKEFVKTMT